jgi:hypothetical protein
MHRKRLTSGLLALWLLALAGLAAAQVKEVRSFRDVDMQLARQGEGLNASFRIEEVFTPRMKKRLSSGFTSRILLGVQVLAGKDKVPVAQALVAYTILYDIWEERFSVRIQGTQGQQRLVLKSMEELVQACSQIRQLSLARLLDLPADLGLTLEVRIQVNPTSPEQMRKVREYLANPDGRSQVGGTKFFGSFSRIFVNEKDFQADALYTYRSRELKLPAR